MKIGDRIKELRERGNLTHAQLARKIGGRCSAATIANYEHTADVRRTTTDCPGLAAYRAARGTTIEREAQVPLGDGQDAPHGGAAGRGGPPVGGRRRCSPAGSWWRRGGGARARARRGARRRAGARGALHGVRVRVFVKLVRYRWTMYQVGRRL